MKFVLSGPRTQMRCRGTTTTMGHGSGPCQTFKFPSEESPGEPEERSCRIIAKQDGHRVPFRDACAWSVGV
jgi:hypothetical protein